MTDRNEQIKEFAAKNNLTEAEATLVYGDGTADDFAKNFALLQEIKGGQSGNQGNQGQTRETDLQRQAQDLIQKADEALRNGDTAKSISLRRQAFDTKNKG
jgi:hypothetical protein